MKNYSFLLLLAGCSCGHSLPPENYDVVITESTKHEVIVSPNEDAGVVVPPMKTWIEPCVCEQGDPLCPCPEMP